jgi:protein CpxP
MKTNNNLQRIVLAAALALPFAAAVADDVAAGPSITAAHPGGPAGHFGPAMHGGPELPGHSQPMGAEGHGRRLGPEALGMPPFGPPPGAPGMMPPPFLHGVDLSEAQQDKVFGILHGQVPYLREQDKTLRKSHEALQALAHAAQYDDAKAASLAQAASQAMANLELARVRTEQKLLAVLTAEQRLEVEQRMAALPQRGPRS